MPKKTTNPTQNQIAAENQVLRARLDEAEETLRAIRSGEVDALVVPADGGDQIFTLKGADQTYRVLVEQMGEGALTLSMDGVILYCNRRFGEMVAISIEHVIGKNIRAFVRPSDRAALEDALESKTGARQELECVLTAAAGASTPAQLALVFLPMNALPIFSLTAVDLTETKRRERELVQVRESVEEHVVERTRDLQDEIAERIQIEEKLKDMSIHDPLTGLYNRGFFDEEMKRLGCGRQFPASILMADLNDLKGINDANGHAAGDAMLQRAAQVLTSAFRAGDIIARIGGDEFAVLLPNTDAALAQQSLRRVRLSLDKHNAAHGGPALSIAIGVSTAQKASALMNTLHEADAQMYMDKHGGTQLAKE